MNPLDDILIHDELERCPYLPEQTARMPLHVPAATLSGHDIDNRLAIGQRRTGDFVYQTKCPACDACKPIRLLVNDFKLDATMRRTLRRNDRLLESLIEEVGVDQRRADLFNLHRDARGLGRDDSRITVEDYTWAFARSCFNTFEIAYYLQGQLICVAITDVGQRALSAVYTYFDPSHAKLSLGTYSILKQIEYCRTHSMDFLYMGFYIATCKHMVYKSRFKPHEKLIGGEWKRFD